MDPISQNIIDFDNLELKCQEYCSSSMFAKADFANAKKIEDLSIIFFESFLSQASISNARNIPSLINTANTFISTIKKMSATPKFRIEAHSKIGNVVNIIQSLVASQRLFLPIDLAFNDIEPLKFVCGYSDTWNLTLFPQLDTFALVCKNWHEIALQAKTKRLLEHIELRKQVESLATSGCKTAEEAIAFVIDRKFKIADLKAFPDINEQHLEELFTKCPSLRHLMIRSKSIKHIPANCQELRTLDCSNCQRLISLPDCLTQLDSLKCWTCPELTSLPDCLTQLTSLNCRYCISLKSLPECLTQLNWLGCSGCKELTSLPGCLTQLSSLDCVRCYALTDLPDSLTQLTSLNCSDCGALEGKGITSLESFKRYLAQNGHNNI